MHIKYLEDQVKQSEAEEAFKLWAKKKDAEELEKKTMKYIEAKQNRAKREVQEV